MKILTKAFLYSLIILIFVGSVGVSVFSHFCSINGNDYSYFIPIEEKCEPITEKTDCCHKEILDEEVKFEKEKCCKEEVSYFKLNTENYSKIIKLKENVKYYKAFSYFSELFPTIFSKEECIALNENGPPIKSGKIILIEYQVFRI